jgi:hypothetical protein
MRAKLAAWARLAIRPTQDNGAYFCRSGGRSPPKRQTQASTSFKTLDAQVHRGISMSPKEARGDIGLIVRLWP